MKCVILTALFAVLLIRPVMPDEEPLRQWEQFSRSAAARDLISWMQTVMTKDLSGEAAPPGQNINMPDFYGRFGIFVTIMRRGNTRGCFGAFHHSSENISTVLKEYLYGALRSDPRYAPLERSEISDAKIIVTVASQAIPVDDIRSVDLTRYGVKATCENEEVVVFVPSEVKTLDYLKRSLRGRRVFEYAVFRAVTIR
jgi:AMMECR1 domain-containing protein